MGFNCLWLLGPIWHPNLLDTVTWHGCHPNWVPIIGIPGWPFNSIYIGMELKHALPSRHGYIYLPSYPVRSRDWLQQCLLSSGGNFWSPGTHNNLRATSCGMVGSLFEIYKSVHKVSINLLGLKLTLCAFLFPFPPALPFCIDSKAGPWQEGEIYQWIMVCAYLHTSGVSLVQVER